MKKPILYCDCDGVIFNTIEIAFNMMQEDGIDLRDKREIDSYFRTKIDWCEVFDKAETINDSINKIKILKESGLFSDIIILTKLSGGYYEEGLKRQIFNELLPGIRVITLQFGLAKASVVNAKNNVLIDDELRNCQNWNKEDGVAILFSQNMSDFEHDIVNDLMDIPHAFGAKRLLKR